MTERLVLYADDFWISPYVFTAFVALREKGVPFNVRRVALQRGEQMLPEFRRRSLTARVPALEHGDFGLAESSAIVEYLEDVFPPPDHPRLLPAAARDRARARQLLAWIRSDLVPIREERSTHTMFYERTRAPLSVKAEEAAQKLFEVAGGLIRDGATTLFGAWSIADTDLAFMLQRLILNGDDVPEALRQFADAEWQRPSVRAFVEHPRPPYEPY